MPKLWRDTVEAHRQAVRTATMETTAALVDQHGLGSVTMSQIAERTGIGRATLYKYFPDVESILVAWHEGRIAGHLEHLAEVRDGADTPLDRLEAVLGAYANIQYEHPVTDLAGLLHRGEHLARAQRHLNAFMRELVVEAQGPGIRDDHDPDTLVGFCVNALRAASGLRSGGEVRRLVTMTMDGLRAQKLAIPTSSSAVLGDSDPGASAGRRRRDA